jgi:protein gp37
MSQKSNIEWTGKTWNPVTGCTKISPGCKNCYAEAEAYRWQKAHEGKAQKMQDRINQNPPNQIMSKFNQTKVIPITHKLLDPFQRPYANRFKTTLNPERLTQPYQENKPTVFFVNSMSDLFHEDVPFAYIDQVMSVVKNCPQHVFQILTKRAERMAEYFECREVPDCAWLGVSVEDRQYGVPRIDHLRQISAMNRFLSVEPLLEDIGQINLSGINWVIVGGESGPGARRMLPEWATSVRDQCIASKVAFFFKQWGAYGEDGIHRTKKANGALLEGCEWKQMPNGIVNIKSEDHEPVAEAVG